MVMIGLKRMREIKKQVPLLFSLIYATRHKISNFILYIASKFFLTVLLK